MNNVIATNRATRLFKSEAYYFEAMLPCPSKTFLGLECPGCGLQRSFLALVKGQVLESIKLYPALIPLLITLVLLAGTVLFRWRNMSRLLLIMYLLDTMLIYGFFIWKLFR